ncbi:MAG: glycosyltransferase family 4 protein [Lachnospiraceae bacterium]|nr:glycosyltransferase family 4 protein [Lachnospiraceae bacterium]
MTAEREKTIAFYISSLTAGGAERVISNLANEFAAQGYEVFMLTDSMEDKEYHRLDGRVRRVVLPKSEENGRIANAIGRIQKLRSAVKETRASVLVSFIGKSNIRAVLATRFLKTGVVVSVRSAPAREYPTRLMRMLAKVLFRMADGIVFQTEEARQFFSKGIKRKSAVLMNPLHPDFMRERYTGGRKQEIVTVGRLHSVKNHEMLIAAFAAVSGDYPALTLRIYGDGDRKEKLRSYIDELHMQGRVVLEGDRDGVAERIEASRIFVLSSNVEGMPNALLEAMALGLACISTDCPCGGPRTVIRDGENGLLIPVGDTEALENAIRRILSDPDLEERLGRHAAEIRQELAPERVNKMWMDYIAHCMKA